jgi:N-acetyl-anhydromuramyl-L-alanine amidase AmpD
MAIERCIHDNRVHHTDNDDSIRDNERRQQGRGYAAIGYHFFIDKQGNVLQGRPLEIMGSHAGTGLSSGPLNDPDWGAIGIVLQGDYQPVLFHSQVPAIQLQRLRELTIALRARFSAISTLLMHREVIRGGEQTDCPGDDLVAPVTEMRRALGLQGGRRR